MTRAGARGQDAGMAVAELAMGPRTSGRAAEALQAVVVRPLGEADVALLAAPRGTTAPSIKKLNSRHHSLARCLAQGMPPFEAAAVTGYDPSRISILQGDPTFAELVVFYRDHEDAQFAEFTKRATQVTITTIERLQDLVENEEEPLTIDQGLSIIKTLADRTGYAPPSKGSQTLNLNLDMTGRLSAAKRRLESLAPPAPVVDAEFEEVAGGDADSATS